MAEVLYPAAQKGVGVRIAHDPGDPLITSHCPFCGSGQVVGRSDGTISCDFCGQVYIVRVQPAFPGMPQMPNGPGAPSDIGPDGGVLPPDAVGPDGLPIGGEEDLPPGAEEDAEGPPFGGEEDEEGGPPEDVSGPPEDAADGGQDEGPPPPKKKDKGKAKKESVKTYRGPDGQVMTEDQFVRHLAAAFSGNNTEVLARLRSEARGRGPYLPVPHPEESGIWAHMISHPEMHPEPPYDPAAAVAQHNKLHQSVPDLHDHVHGPRPDLGTPILRYLESDQPQDLHEHLVSHHGFTDGETGYQPDDMSGYAPTGSGQELWDLHHNEHQVAGQYQQQGLDYPPGVMPIRHVHRSVHGTPLEASKA